MANTICTPIAPEDFRRTPWKNGGGVAIDIAGEYRPGTAAGDWDAVIWRFGRTAIVAPGPFSDLSGYERLQVVVSGSGLVLVTPTGEIGLRRPFAPVRYDGGTPIVTRLEDGPVEVVNLIADRTLCAIDLHVVAAGESRSLDEGIHILYAPESGVTGRCGETGIALPGGHALRVDATAPASLTLSSGRALLASIGRL
jgi:environmental stress-induced protein Ves